MKNFWILIVLALGLSSLSCTKSKDTPKEASNPKEIAPTQLPVIVNYESPIQFSFSKKLKNQGLAYKIGDNNLPMDQLFRSDKSLLRLVTENKAFWLVSAFLQAQKEKANGVQQVQVKLPFPSGDLNTEQILQDKGLPSDSSISFIFSDKEDFLGMTTINNKEFSEIDLSKNNIDHSRNLTKVFNLAMKRIETRISRAVISEAAKSKGQNFNQYVEENSQGNGEVTNDDILAFAKENSIPQKDLNEKMKKTVRQIIKSKTQNSVFLSIASELLAQKPVEVGFFRPYIRTTNVNLPEGTPTTGNGNVKVTFVSNFLCKRCVKTQKKLAKLFEDLAEKIKISYLFKIRPEERISKYVAEVGLCVHKLDPNKFWSFHNETFSDDFDGNEQKVNGIIESLDLKVEDIHLCFSSRNSNKILAKHLEVTQAMNSLTLPIVIINGNIFENPASTEEIRKLIEHEHENYIPAPSPHITHSKTKKSWWQWIKGLFS